MEGLFFIIFPGSSTRVFWSLLKNCLGSFEKKSRFKCEGGDWKTWKTVKEKMEDLKVKSKRLPKKCVTDRNIQ